MRRLGQWVILGVMWAAAIGAHALSPPPLLQKDYQQLPDSAGIAHYLKALAKEIPFMQYKILGQSAGGREFGALWISTDPSFLRGDLPSGDDKLIALMVGSQHGTEASGTEALMQFAYMLARAPSSTYLDHYHFILVVNGNPDGRDLGKRQNAANKNLNIDYVEIQQPETRILASLIHQYHPDVLLDLHESSIQKSLLKSQGYYTEVRAQYEVGNHPNIDKPLKTLMQQSLLPAVIQKTIDNGLPAQHYRGEITDVDLPVAHGGLRLSNFRNYSAMLGTVSFLVENRLDPKNGHYPTPHNIKARVSDQYCSVKSFLEALIPYKASIRRVLSQARERIQAGVSRHQRTIFNYQYGLNWGQPIVEVPLFNLKLQHVENVRFKNFDTVETLLEGSVPANYAVLSHSSTFIPFLKAHRIGYEILEKSRQVEGIVLDVLALEWDKKASFGRRGKMKMTTQLRVEPFVLPKGSLIINTHAPRGLLAALFLDLRATDNIYQEPRFQAVLAPKAPLQIVAFSEPN